MGHGREVVLVNNDDTVSRNFTDDARVRSDAQNVAVAWLQGYSSVNTRNSYANHIGLNPELRRWDGAPANPRLAAGAFLPWCAQNGVDPLGGMTEEALKAWLHHLTTVGVSSNSRRVKFDAINAFYKFARRRGWTQFTAEDLERRRLGLYGNKQPEKPTVPLLTAQVRALFLAATFDNERTRARTRAILAILAGTGCRASELVELDLHHYRRPIPGGHAELRLRGKGGKWRTVRLHATDADLVDEYLRVRPGPKVTAELAYLGNVSADGRVRHPLITNRSGQRTNPKTITNLLNRIAAIPTQDHPSHAVREAHRALAGLSGTIGPHQFRHFFAITASRNGVPIEQIRDALGHANISTTNTYLANAQRLEDNAASLAVSNVVHAGEDLVLPGMRQDDEGA